MQSLNQLFYKYTGVMPDSVEQLSASGSNRRYFRLTAKDAQQTPISLIGVQGTSAEENHAFLYMDKHFLEHGLNVPRVVAQSDDEMIYLQEDLGDTLLFKASFTAPFRHNIAQMKGYVFVGENVVAEAQLTAQVIKNE